MNQWKSSERSAVAAAILGNTIFGLSFLFSKSALSQVKPFVLLSVRFTVAFFILSLILMTGKARMHLKGKPVGRVLVLGVIQPILYFTFENYGIKGTTTAFAGSLLAIVPVVSLIAGALFLGERPSRTQAAGAFLSVAGVFMVSAVQTGGRTNLAGAILLFGAVCSSVAFNLVSRKISSLFTVFERTYIMFALGSIFFTAAALWQVGGNLEAEVFRPMMTPGFWVSIIYLAGFASVGAFLMINYSVSHLSLARVSVFTNLVTVVSIAAGVAVLKESFTFLQFAGSGVILTGVYLANRK